MPGTFPAAAPVLTGDSLAISRFLQSPTALARRLRDYRDLRFVSDQLLTQRFKSSGGAVIYEMTEPFVSDRTAESVGAGSEYPYANMPTGTAGLAAIQKWGQKVLLTDEEISRNAYGGAAVDRQMRKVINTVISQVDAITMSAIASAVTATFPATGSSWATSTVIMRDIFRAVAQVVALNLGYVPDTLAVNDTAAAYIMSDPTITNALRRETTDNPVYTGQISRLIGLTIVTSPAIPQGQAWVLDSTQLGGMADEVDGAPGYSVSDLAVQVKSIRKDENDAWDLQGRRKTVPVIQEPGAAVRIINTAL
jgi:hypothetical protein